jgi:hypothetical protein
VCSPQMRREPQADNQTATWRGSRGLTWGVSAARSGSARLSAERLPGAVMGRDSGPEAYTRVARSKRDQGLFGSWFPQSYSQRIPVIAHKA